MRYCSLIFLVLFCSLHLHAQVGIGTATPASNTQLTVLGNNTVTGIKASAGTPSLTYNLTAGIYGESLSGPGVVGTSQNFSGIIGGSTGNFYAGVSGNTSAPAGYGIWGTTTSTGIAGFFDGGTVGIGLSVSRGGVGIGTTAPNGRLVVQQNGTTGIDTAAAIYGYANSSVSSYKGGVFGTYNTSNYGTGIQGIGLQGVLLSNAPASFPNVFNTTHVGVYGSAATAGVIGTSVAGSGVRGFSTSSQGLLGYSQASTTGGAVGVGHTIGVFCNAITVGTLAPPTNRYGIYAQASGATTNNWAGYFIGNVNITGSISKGSGTFKIDHPLDPENKYLYHSFVESPDMMNIYNGNTVTDEQGYATVTLPDYFDALNKEFRYQLTVIGTFAQAIIKEEINGNSFKIQTNAGNVKVSWQVTGVRKDKFAEAHRVVAEVEKEKENKGRYVHAAEWGQPENKEINYEINHPKEQQ